MHDEPLPESLALSGPVDDPPSHTTTYPSAASHSKDATSPYTPLVVDVKPCSGNDGVEEQTDVVVVANVVEMVLEVVIGEQTYVD